MGWRRSFWMHPQTMRSTNSHHWRYLLIYSNYPISTGEFDTILSGWFTVSHVLLFFACMISLFIQSFWIKVVHLPGIHLQSFRARLQWGRHNSPRTFKQRFLCLKLESVWLCSREMVFALTHKFWEINNWTRGVIVKTQGDATNLRTRNLMM